MIIECPKCESKVDARTLAVKEYESEIDYDRNRILFLECPVCDEIILGNSNYIQVGMDEWVWTLPSRLWPQPVEPLHFSIPRLAQKSLEEARKCFQAQAYSACAVMGGRAIEGICVAHNTKDKNLARGLRELRDRNIIDQRLYEWGETLREQRNIGAHANEDDISREDARDVLDFAVAFCEYIFVLSEKYEGFRERQALKAARKSRVSAAATAPPTTASTLIAIEAGPPSDLGQPQAPDDDDRG